MPRSNIVSSEDINVDAMFQRRARKEMRENKTQWETFLPAYAADKPNEDVKSFFFDPMHQEQNYFGGIRTISPYYGRLVAPKILRHVAEKAWIINLCIATSIKQARPYFKESTGENQRGFRIKNKKAVKASRDMTKGEKAEAEKLINFLMNTGDVEDVERIDDLDKYMTKIIRDIYQLDQISTELQYTRGNELCAFWAMDTATIEIILPGSSKETGLKYAQVINNIPYAYYTKDQLIFDCMNPRTDITKAGYGYSVVEQAIDLVTSSINTFFYNAGFFTEDKLPRGMLLLNAAADQDEVEDIGDYISNLMSGPPSAKWRIPIIPTGRTKGESGSGKVFEWVNLQGSNKDMEFQNWHDFQLSGIVAMFGKTVEELGLHSSKSQPLFGQNNEPRIEASKSLGLGDLLTFMQKHLNQILSYKNPDYCFEFIGYEKDDLKLVADIDDKEIGSWKTLNEKRQEKGMEAIDINKVENPADLPMSPQVVQLFQSIKAGGGMGEMNDFDMTDEDFEEGQGDVDSEDTDVQDNEDTQDGENNEEWDAMEEQFNVKKSLAGSNILRIAI